MRPPYTDFENQNSLGATYQVAQHQVAQHQVAQHQVAQHQVAQHQVAQYQATHKPNAPNQPTGPKRGSLGAIIAQFKRATTLQINQLLQVDFAPVWQRSYHDHIIRSEKILNATREYILYNPACWDTDEENPANLRR